MGKGHDLECVLVCVDSLVYISKIDCQRLEDDRHVDIFVNILKKGLS